MAAEIALGHHERWNGTGYPSGLRALEIPLCARIVAVADFLDALMMDRCYRPALGEDEVLALIKAGRGSHFDPAIVDVAVTLFPQLVALRKRIDQRTAAEQLDGAAAAPSQ